MNILMVEDDYIFAKVTARYLERLKGCHVQVTIEPSLVYELCRDRWPEVVLMDVNLPGATWQGKWVSGADLSRGIKTNPLTRDIPVLLVTAYAMEEDRQHLMATSLADDLWTKPITDFKRLADTVASYCNAKVPMVG